MNKQAILSGASAILIGLSMAVPVLATNGSNIHLNGRNPRLNQRINVSKDQKVNIICIQSQVNVPQGQQTSTNPTTQTATVVGRDDIDETQEVENTVRQLLNQTSNQEQTNCTININNGGNQNVNSSATPAPTASPTPSASPTASPSPTATPVTVNVANPTPVVNVTNPTPVVNVTVPQSAPSTGRGL